MSAPTHANGVHAPGAQILPSIDEFTNEEGSGEKRPSHVCSMCNGQFVNAHAFASHIISAHSKQTCAFCGEAYYPHEYQQHLMVSALHPKCLECRVGFQAPTQFDEHLWLCHPDGGCNKCKVHCRTAAALLQHYHDSSSHPVCSHCGSGFVDGLVLSKHIDYVHLGEQASYFHRGRPVLSKNDDLSIFHPPSPSALGSPSVETPCTKSWVLAEARSDSDCSESRASSMLMLPPLRHTLNPSEELLVPQAPSHFLRTPPSRNSILTPVTEESRNGCPPSPTELSYCSTTHTTPVVARLPLPPYPCLPRFSDFPVKMSRFGQAVSSSGSLRLRAPTAPATLLQSKTSPLSSSSQMAAEPTANGPPLQVAADWVMPTSVMTDEQRKPDMRRASLSLRVDEQAVRSPIIETDTETTSNISVSFLSSASTHSNLSSMLPEGGNEACVVGVAQRVLAPSDEKRRVYDQPAEAPFHARESASAQHPESPASARPVEHTRNAATSSLPLHIPRKLGLLHCRMCLQDPCDKPTATLCGHLFCKSCISQAVATDCQCPVCKRAILIPLDV